MSNTTGLDLESVFTGILAHDAGINYAICKSCHH